MSIFPFELNIKRYYVLVGMISRGNRFIKKITLILLRTLRVLYMFVKTTFSHRNYFKRKL